MNEEINKPLYIRIQEYIAELILSGKLVPETKIQSERDFSEDLGVSRMTVRRAITELVNEGLLERKHGSGTYVARPKVTYESAELINYGQAMQHRNIATASQLLEFGELAASRRLAESLQIEIGNPIYRVTILRFANRVPVILERVFIPCGRCPDLEEWDLEKSSVYDLLTDIYHINPGRSSQTVEAVAAADIVAQQLRVEDGFPLLMLSRVVFEEKVERPIVFSQDFLRSDYARIHTTALLEEQNEKPQEVSTRKEEMAGKQLS
ncbi:MAG TPA: GntR family transcriptional regulator [Anaerolineales bacterium]|nr:GntR family transcriptional regulator [Anaerolineales bacterium]